MAVAFKASFPEIRARAIAQRPYLAKLLWNLIPVQTDGLGTFAVDQHLRVQYDPAVVAAWGLERCAAVLLHEALHILLGHHARCQRIAASTEGFNVAADLEINSILCRDGLAPDPLGADCLYPSKFGFPDGLTAEEYYALLQKSPAPQPQPQSGDGKPQSGDGKSNDSGTSQSGDGDGKSGNGDGKPQSNNGEGKPSKGDRPSPGSGKCGGCAGHPGEWELPAPEDASSELSRKLLQKAVAEDIRKAAASGRGSIPGALLGFADATLEEAKIPWREVLRSEMVMAAERVLGADLTTYARPSRLSHALAQHGGAMLPSWYTPALTVGVVLDTSGSMGHRVQLALNEVQEIVQSLNARVLFTSVDSRAAEVQEIVDLRAVPLQGGGGTDMRVGIRAVQAHNPRPDLIVVLTDCDTPWPSEPTSEPLIVAAIDPYPYALSSVPSWAITVTVED